MARSGEPDAKRWRRWRQLVNMSAGELDRFLGTEEGRVAGTAVGQQSARALLRMLPTGTSFGRAVAGWTPEQWRWVGRQVSFISRMRAGSGSLYDAKGQKSRRHTSLLLWGHDPRRALRRVSAP